MKPIAITGGYGFLAWHLACRLRALHGVEPLRLGRDGLVSADRLAGALAGVDIVVHLAGVNRAPSDDEVLRGNAGPATVLADALVMLGRPVHVVYGSSVQAPGPTAYGRSKAAAGEVLRAATSRSGGTLSEVVLPNLFGEHGRPAYNSFVATFCHEVAGGRLPQLTGDREIHLLHAQEAAQVLIDCALSRHDGIVAPHGERHRVSEVLATLQAFHELYAGRREVPALTGSFARDLFNTYRSYLMPGGFPMRAVVHDDQRGRLFETVRSHGPAGQAFASTTVPGATRGNHYHLHKVERFFVVRGEAEIALRRLLYADVVRFRLSGDDPAFVDMPTMWVHNLTNVGDSELVTVFWTDQLLDPSQPDQYPELVEAVPEVAQ